MESKTTPQENQVNAILQNEERLNALYQTKLLDSEIELAFDRFTHLTKHLLKVPVSLISLIDDSRQFFKSSVGLPEPFASDNYHQRLLVALQLHISMAKSNNAVGDAEKTAVSLDDIEELVNMAISKTRSDSNTQTQTSFCHLP